MKKGIRRVLVLGILIFSLILMSVGIGLSDELAIMHPTKEMLDQWVADYENADRAENVLIPLRIKERGGSFSLLDHLQYDPVTRDQGYCGNCWVWAGTGVMGVALDVQEGTKDRLSIQYLNSCKTDSYACCGGNLTDFADFYSTTKKAIPWSNTNASFQDYNRTCEDGHSLVSCSSISTSPNYPIKSITPLKITTHRVSQAEAINNIKNVLHNNKAVYFVFCLPNSTAWDDFFNFWLNYDESAVYDIDKFCGIPWNDEEGGCHAVLCVGYNDNDRYWIMLNSWGTAGGRRPNGLFRVNMDMNYRCVNYPYYSFYWQTLDIDFGEVGGWPFCLYYDWNRDLVFGSATVNVHSNHTFTTEHGGEGYWEIYNGAVSLTFTTGCCPLFAGSMGTMAGFMKCTDGSQGCEELPGYWYATPGECQQMQVGDGIPSAPNF